MRLIAFAVAAIFALAANGALAQGTSGTPIGGLSVDHIHLVSKDPQAAARWYVDKLGGEIVRSIDSKGSSQYYVSLAGVLVLVRGQRSSEGAVDKPGLQWGVDHFALRVQGDFDRFCAELRARGVAFRSEPRDFDANTRIAFISAPDGVSVELVSRKGQP